MNKSRIIAFFLIASWTLNVALLVAYYMKTTYPPGATIDFPERCGPMMPPPHIPGEIRECFKLETANLHEAQLGLINDISSAFTANELDTVMLMKLSDSLNAVRSELQFKLMSHLSRLHRELPVEERYRMSQRMNRMMDGRMHGPDRNKFKKHQRRFKPDSNRR